MSAAWPASSDKQLQSMVGMVAKQRGSDNMHKWPGGGVGHLASSGGQERADRLSGGFALRRCASGGDHPSHCAGMGPVTEMSFPGRTGIFRTGILTSVGAVRDSLSVSPAPSEPPMSSASPTPDGPDNAIASTRLLWKRLMKGPKSIGTVAPSSPWLARALVGVSALHDAETIVEVGAGTGPLTGWIRESAPQARLIAVEPDEELRQALEKTYPDIEVSGVLARQLPGELRARGLNGVDRILSTVPWTLLPEHVMERELDGVEAALRPGGRFVTLVYVHTHAMKASKRLENSLRRRFATVTQSGVVWRNVPPGRWLVAESPRQKL